MKNYNLNFLLTEQFATRGKWRMGLTTLKFILRQLWSSVRGAIVELFSSPTTPRLRNPVRGFWRTCPIKRRADPKCIHTLNFFRRSLSLQFKCSMKRKDTENFGIVIKFNWLWNSRGGTSKLNCRELKIFLGTLYTISELGTKVSKKLVTKA